MSVNPLLTSAMLDRVRSIGARTLTQSFTILVRTTEPNDYGDGSEVYVDSGDYLGRIRQMNNADLGEGIAVVSAVGMFRLHLPPTVSIAEGDMVADTAGNLYVVNNSNSEDTIRVFTTAMVQKIQ